jgi:hypothetical protein
VNGSQSNDKLACKDALLETTINTNVTGVPNFGVRSLSRLLGTKRINIYHALVKGQSFQALGASQFTLSHKKKRLDRVSMEDKASIVTWWLTETRVSPNKKDLTCKRVGPKLYKEHVTHFLLEIQVSDYLTSLACVFFCVIFPTFFFLCNSLFSHWTRPLSPKSLQYSLYTIFLKLSNYIGSICWPLLVV